jgi:alpha/beta superfamily hydrolase
MAAFIPNNQPSIPLFAHHCRPAPHGPYERKMKSGMSPTPAPDQVAPRASCEGAASGTIRSLTLDGPAGRLEAVLNPGAPDAPFAALICHPHPMFGGNLHNKVVYHAMKVMNDPAWGLGWPVLRFNFRGAGLSDGDHDGEAESGDVLAALEWLDQEFQRPLIVAGYSFGAAMALKACCGLMQIGGTGLPRTPRVRAFIALGLPTQADGPAYRYSFLRELAMPKLFLSGDRDSFAPAIELAQVAASAPEPKRLILLQGADHFFTGYLDEMQRAMADWLREQLP